MHLQRWSRHDMRRGVLLRYYCPSKFPRDHDKMLIQWFGSGIQGCRSTKSSYWLVEAGLWPKLLEKGNKAIENDSSSHCVPSNTDSQFQKQKKLKGCIYHDY